MKQEILEIKSLIDRLRALDPEFCTFGSDTHRYRIGSPLSEAEIIAFEQQHGIVLPADYRLYLQLVGNGDGVNAQTREREDGKGGTVSIPMGPEWRAGAGPHYGLYYLSETVLAPNVNQPFLYEKETDISAQLPDDWDWNTPGILMISTPGCNNDTCLVVKGAAYGTVWNAWDQRIFHPTGLSFAQWMRDWAEHSIAFMERRPLVDRIFLGMTLEQVANATVDDWKEQSFGAAPYYHSSTLGIDLESDEQGVVTRIYSHFWKFDTQRN